MRPIRLASRYAKALFEMAGEQNIRDEVFRDMRMLNEVCAENRPLRLMLQSPVIRFDKKNNVIREIFSKHFHATTLAYTDIITRKGRETILPEIAEQYITFYRDWKGIKVAHLTTAVEVDQPTRTRITDLLKLQLKAEIELQTKVNPSLIGGFVLWVDDRQIDTSILRKINKLTREFNVNIYERKI